MAGRYLGVSELWVSLVKEVLHRYVMRPVAAVAAAIILMGFHSCVSDQMPTNVCCWEARQLQGRGWTFQSLLDPLAYHSFLRAQRANKSNARLRICVGQAHGWRGCDKCLTPQIHYCGAP
jgi:hypothetical protein